MTEAPPSTPPAAQTRSRAGAITLLILGILITMLAIGPLVGGAVLAGFGAQQQRDGFLYSQTVRLSADGYALTSQPFTVGDGLDQAPTGLASMKVAVRSASDGFVFIGIASRDDVARYLNGVNYSEIRSIRLGPSSSVDYREVPGASLPADPRDQDFWELSDSGTGERSIETDLRDIRSGDWVFVIMTGESTAQVSVDAQAGVQSNLWWPLAIGLLVSGIVALLIGVPMLVLGAAGTGRDLPAGSTAVAGRRYPAQLTGTLSPRLSRGLWLVKWLLAIPHFIVLAFLWVACVVTSVIAWFAILITGRYPRALFNFNVGVLRWSWRVAFYGYSALGTDEYPPFSLAQGGYPADLTIDYPERLSRGLVLVKSWLLAIPHLIIVGIIAGTATWSTMSDYRWGEARGSGVSLLGILVLIAGVALLFTGRYLPSLFDFIMGLNRWTYRVIAYVGLFRDEYPPFRLDQGPEEPAGDEPDALQGPTDPSALASNPGALNPGASKPAASSPDGSSREPTTAA